MRLARMISLELKVKLSAMSMITRNCWEVLTMELTEMFNICDACVYAPGFCGNEPENCVDYCTKNGPSLPCCKGGGADNGEAKDIG